MEKNFKEGLTVLDQKETKNDESQEVAPHANHHVSRTLLLHNYLILTPSGYSHYLMNRVFRLPMQRFCQCSILESAKRLLQRPAFKLFSSSCCLQVVSTLRVPIPNRTPESRVRCLIRIRRKIPDRPQAYPEENLGKFGKSPSQISR